VNPKSTTTTTQSSQDGTTVYRGTPVHDTATVTGALTGFPLTGSVTFFICNPVQVAANGGDCDGTGVGGAGQAVGSAVTIDANGHAVSTPDFTGDTMDGTWCWRAEFTPDTTNYTGSKELTSNHECFTIASSTIIITKSTKPAGAPDSFSFTRTGTGYVQPTDPFFLHDGQSNTVTGLNAGSYSATEGVGPNFVLTGVDCSTSGGNGSTGTGDTNTRTATITLNLGDTVTCVFQNTLNLTTRTQGFWATHPQLANIAWFGGTFAGHTFAGAAATPGVGDISLCGRDIATLNELMGGFWSSIPKDSTGKKRSSLDQARMQLLQQLLAAELNAVAFNATPSVGSISAWETAFCGTDQKAIQTAQAQAASFNESGDSGVFTPGTSADSKTGKADGAAGASFWDKLPAGV
jgi:hypothetical protein